MTGFRTISSDRLIDWEKINNLPLDVNSELALKVDKTTTVNLNALSWNITLTQDDIWDWTTNKQYSQTEKTKLAWIWTWAKVVSVVAWTNASVDNTDPQNPIIWVIPWIGLWDMVKSTYDPTNINASAFSQDNMLDWTTNKNYTATEKTKLAWIAEWANVWVIPNTPITGATKTKITYDTKGLVTTWEDATYEDIVYPTAYKIGNPTHIDTLQEIFNHEFSSWVMHLCDITDNWDWTVSFSSWFAMIRAVADPHTALYSVAVNAQTNLALTDNATNYVYLDYNGGSPQFVASTSITSFNCMDKCIAYMIHRDGTTLDIVDAREQNVDWNRKSRQLFLKFSKFIHADWWTVLWNPSTTTISLSSGEFFFMLQSLPHDAFDTSVAWTANANVFKLWYRDWVGWWTSVANSKTVDTTTYDNNSWTLATLWNNKWWVNWFYLVHNSPSKLHSVKWQSEYASQADALAAQPPSSLPPIISWLGSLVWFVVYQKSAITFSNVLSAFSQTFTGSAATSHTWLSNLAWTSSWHTWTATRIAWFDWTWVASEYTLSWTWATIPTTTSPTFTTPILWTPTSWTLTNCSWLPISWITSSTTQALWVGSIELWHASDTTISRVSAWQIAVEWVNVLMNWWALWTPSSWTATNITWLPEWWLTLADNTTNDVSITKHWFTPKAPNDTTKFLRWDWTWAVPSTSSSTIQIVHWELSAWDSPASSNRDGWLFSASATNNIYWWFIVPSWYTSISSMVINTVPITTNSWNVVFSVTIQRNRVATTRQSDSDTARAYTYNATTIQWLQVTINAAAYDWITLQSGDWVWFSIDRLWADAWDTYTWTLVIHSVVITLA